MMEIKCNYFCYYDGLVTTFLSIAFVDIEVEDMPVQVVYWFRG